ncbi:MAG: ABC transporter permease [Gemmatimonadota bacterium]
MQPSSLSVLSNERSSDGPTHTAGQPMLTLRRLRNAPGFTASAVATLALGIGANIAIFSLLDAVALRPLPYPHPDRLVAVWPSQNFNQALVEELAHGAPALAGVAGISHWSLTLVGTGRPERLKAAVVSTSFFDVLGVKPRLGRAFLSEEHQPDRSGVVMLTYGFWQRRFGGDPSVVGRTVQLVGYDHESYQVIGVLGPDFRSLHQPVDVYIPLHVGAGRTVATDSTWYVNNVVARLAPAATVRGAAAHVHTVAQRLRQRFPGRLDDDQVARATVVPYVNVLVGDARRTLWVLMGAVGLVLIIACANVANLLLARGSRRTTEIALRQALGATRRRIAGESLKESLALAALGGLAGLALAAALLKLLEPSVVQQLPRVTRLGLDPTALVFAFGATAVAALAAGVLPAVRSSARDPNEGIRSGAPTLSGQRHGRLNRSLVAAELALAVMLVSGSVLMLQSVWRLMHTDPGFDARGVLALATAPPDARWNTGRDAQTALNEAVLTRLAAIPGVADVGAVHLLPMTQANWAFPYWAEGHTPPANAPLPSVNFRIVTPGYFRTMHIPLVKGRAIASSDDAHGVHVAIINATFAARLWPGEDAVGKEIKLFGSDPYTVVGVVGDIRQTSLGRAPRPEMYVPLPQFPVAAMVFMVRMAPGATTASLAPALRRAVWDVDPDVAIPTLRPLEDVVSDSVATQRLAAWLLAGFAFVALLLGIVGVYGVMAYVIGGRTREFAVRNALGATRAEIERGAIAYGVPPLLVGLTLGIAGTLATGRLFAGMLYGVRAWDPVTLLGVAGLLGGASLVASWIPARGLGRVSVMKALRD